MIENFSPDTKPLWSDTAVVNRHSHLVGDLEVDVCIIGAGITGLTAADLLKKQGKRVAVVELSRIGWGETSHTTAHLTEVFDLDYRHLVSHFGLEGARLAAQSQRRAIERIEANVKEYGIDCDFQRVAGYRFTKDPKRVDEIEDDAEAAVKVGVPNEVVDEAPLPFRIAKAIRFPQQAQFDPMKYMAGLAQQISGDSCHIFEETRMLDVQEGEPCKVITDRGTITAKDVIVAANVPSTNKFFLHTKLAAYRTYAIAVRLKEGASYNNLYWDIADPYHYVRNYDFNGVPHLIIGGEDHKTGKDTHTGIHFQKLEDWAHEHFDVLSVTHRWSGQVIEPVDGLPYIGKNPLSDNVYVATGFSGNGMTLGTVSGMLLSDMIVGNLNPWEDLYAPSRLKPIASFKQFVTENIDFPSHLIGDRLTPAQASSTDRLRENEGAIVRMGGKKVAAYRDPEGKLHLMSPVCPHMGCYVGWNEAEKSWDCPCHGSRFNPLGQLLNGPAVADLASETFDENAPMTPERYEKEQPAVDPLGAPLMSFFSCPCKAQPT